MKILLRILLFPIRILLRFLYFCISVITKAASSILIIAVLAFILGALLAFSEGETWNGIGFLFLSFLASPLGVPMIGSYLAVFIENIIDKINEI